VGIKAEADQKIGNYLLPACNDLIKSIDKTIEAAIENIPDGFLKTYSISTENFLAPKQKKQNMTTNFRQDQLTKKRDTGRLILINGLNQS